MKMHKRKQEKTLRKDLEMLNDVHGVDPENTTASISVVDALIERLYLFPLYIENLPTLQEQSNVGDTAVYRKGYADAVQEVINHVKNFGE